MPRRLLDGRATDHRRLVAFDLIGDRFAPARHCPYLLADDEATATWAMADRVLLTDLDLVLEGAAYIEDRYERIDGRWVIAATAYRRIYEVLYPPSSVTGYQVTADWWSTGGRSNLNLD